MSRSTIKYTPFEIFCQEVTEKICSNNSMNFKIYNADVQKIMEDEESLFNKLIDLGTSKEHINAIFVEYVTKNLQKINKPV